MPKGNFHQLVAHIPPAAIDTEVSEKLDAIARGAESAVLTVAERSKRSLKREKRGG